MPAEPTAANKLKHFTYGDFVRNYNAWIEEKTREAALQGLCFQTVGKPKYIGTAGRYTAVHVMWRCVTKPAPKRVAKKTATKTGARRRS